MNPVSVGILLFDGVEVLDFAGPFEVFSQARLVPGVASRRTNEGAPFQVFTVAKVTALLQAVGGLQVLPHYHFADCPPIDLLVVPGGVGTRALLEDGEVLAWIHRVAAGAKLVTSVCTGSLLLARTGLLAGRRATTHWGALDLLASLDPTIEVERTARVVRDGVFSSAGVAAGMDMAFSVVAHLCGEDAARDTAHYIEYPWPRPDAAVSG